MIGLGLPAISSVLIRGYNSGSDEEKEKDYLSLKPSAL